MKALISKALDAVWNDMRCPDKELRTPDDARGSLFSVESSDKDSITILTSGYNRIKIKKEAFIVALQYLDKHQHGHDNKCEIRTGRETDVGGGLCKATRDIQKGQAVIGYIAPMLATTGLVKLDGGRPNKIWLA